MKLVPPVFVALCILAAGCGGGGAGTQSQSTNPSNITNTYVGQYYNAQNVSFGTATVVVQGANLQATLTPTGPYSTILITGTVVNGEIMSSGTFPSDIGTESVVGSHLTINGYNDTINHLGILSISATLSSS